MRRAYTLTELLVVITIVVILVAATLPLAKRVMDDSRTRDSARLLAGNFGMARTYAARNNRPFGLWFELKQPLGQPANVRQCTDVYLAEVSAPYAGDVTSAVAGVVPDLRIPGPMPITFSPVGVAMLPTLLSHDDNFTIQFGFKGKWFDAFYDRAAGAPDRFYLVGLGGPDGAWGKVGVDDDFDGTADNLNIDTNGDGTPDRSSEYGATGSDDVVPPLPATGLAGAPFKILRRPVKVGNPITLLAGTAVDLSYSGMGPYGDQFAGAAGTLVVMFSPKGEVEEVFADSVRFPTAGTLHFLIGQVDKVSDPGTTGATHPTGYNMFDPVASNLSDPNSVWVSVGRLNGQVATSENLIPPVETTPPPTPTSLVLFPTDPRQQTIDPSQAAGRGVYLGYCREASIARDQMSGK